MAVMIALLPIPGLITKLVQNTRREQMKKTDGRVQAVTDSQRVSLFLANQAYSWMISYEFNAHDQALRMGEEAA
jgi:hypothetical protein